MGKKTTQRKRAAPSTAAKRTSHGATKGVRAPLSKNKRERAARAVGKENGDSARSSPPAVRRVVPRVTDVGAQQEEQRSQYIEVLRATCLLMLFTVAVLVLVLLVENFLWFDPFESAQLQSDERVQVFTTIAPRRAVLHPASALLCDDEDECVVKVGTRCHADEYLREQAANDAERDKVLDGAGKGCDVGGAHSGGEVPHSTRWRVSLPIHMWVYEPEMNDTVRAAAWVVARGIEYSRGSALGKEERIILEERGGMFLVDNQRGKRVDVQVCGRQYPLAPSNPNGHIYDMVSLSEADVVQCQDKRVALQYGDGVSVVSLEVAHPVTSAKYHGNVLLLDDCGWSVISDVDDTVKATQVSNKQSLLRQTFLRTFVPIEGMPELYTEWQRDTGAVFHYVSSSPWVLYQQLRSFFYVHGLPPGSHHFRHFRWKDESLLGLLRSPEQKKRSAIVPLLEQFPKRKFVMVGDSAEKDPEIYGRIAREFPEQIVRCAVEYGSECVRKDRAGTEYMGYDEADLATEVTGAELGRYERAFAGLPRTMWQLFKDPKDIRFPFHGSACENANAVIDFDSDEDDRAD